MANPKRQFRGIWMPKAMWLSHQLSPQEKFFLIEIDSLDNENGCTAGNQHFAELFGLSKDRVSEIINSLKDKKILEIKLEKSASNLTKRTVKIKSENLKQYLFFESIQGEIFGGGIGENTDTGYRRKRRGVSAKTPNLISPDNISSTKVEDRVKIHPQKFFGDENKQEEVIETLIQKGVSENFARAEIKKFVSYWTEPNRSGNRVRWEAQPFFDVPRRLSTWFKNSQKFNGKGQTKPTEFLL